LTEAENAGASTAFFKFKEEQELLDDEGMQSDAELGVGIVAYKTQVYGVNHDV
jgi:hypothetical protein